jgi:hypothetical protein
MIDHLVSPSFPSRFLAITLRFPFPAYIQETGNERAEFQSLKISGVDFQLLTKRMLGNEMETKGSENRVFVSMLNGSRFQFVSRSFPK